jgi:hypothetical protein
MAWLTPARRIGPRNVRRRVLNDLVPQLDLPGLPDQSIVAVAVNAPNLILASPTGQHIGAALASDDIITTQSVDYIIVW